MNSKSDVQWVTLDGKWSVGPDGLITFEGEEQEITVPVNTKSRAGKSQPLKAEHKTERIASVGLSICNRTFSEGDISVDVEFEKDELPQIAEIVVQFEPAQKNSLHAGIGGASDGMFSIRLWAPMRDFSEADGKSSNSLPAKAWTYFNVSGNSTELKKNITYNLKIKCVGTKIHLSVNGVVTNSYDMAFALQNMQVGLFAVSKSKVKFSNFNVKTTKPQAFIVMQFNTEQYEDLLSEVIEPVCEEKGLRAYRASDTYSPGIVISDIAREIEKSRLVIAEITPANPNVYYEVGYADALKKPIILIADRNMDKIPFDVRPYRIIFYENSIGGKKRVEDDLRRYLDSILGSGSF